MSGYDSYTDDELAVDTLARELYEAHLRVTGWSDLGAWRKAQRECPDSFYDTAESMISSDEGW